jgi:hypothetical protein
MFYHKYLCNSYKNKLLNYPRLSRHIFNYKPIMGGDSSTFAGDIKVEVDAAIDGLNQRLREVNRKVCH